jgi:hypothetical protein
MKGGVKSKMENQKILIIEDNLKHLQDAIDFFAEKPETKIITARNYEEAEKTLYKSNEKYQRIMPDIEGVISDIYFPLCNDSHWDQPEPIGIKVALECSRLGLPFVLNTAGYHHGRRYEWINHLASSEDWNMVDNGSDYEQDADSKDWNWAFNCLERQILENKK